MRVFGLVVALVGACAHPQPAAPPSAKEDPKALVDEGDKALEAGKLDDADRLYTRAAQLGDVDAWTGLVWVRGFKGDDAGVWEAFAHQAPEAQVPLERAWILFANGKLDDALVADTKAMAEVTKADADSWIKAPMVRGGVLIAAGRFADAIEPLTLAVQRVPEVGKTDDPYFRTVPLFLYAWAAARANTGDAAGAVAKLDAIAAANPDDRILGLFLPVAHGELAIAKGDLAAAEEALSKCPRNTLCLDALAEVQDARGKHDAAAATRAQIRTIFRANPPGLYYWRKNQPH